MSRQIDLTKELTEDEVQYLEDRGWQHMLDENAKNLMGGGVLEEEVEEEVVVEETTTVTSTGDTSSVENPPGAGAIEPPPLPVDEKTGDNGAAAGADDQSE